jgi:hypothetical protein
MPHRRYFVHSLVAAGVAATTVPILDRQPRSNEEIHYQRIVVENETSGGNTVRVMRDREGTDIIEHFFSTFAADVPQVYADAEIVISGEDRLRLDWIGSAAADVLRATVEGYVWDKE